MAAQANLSSFWITNSFQNLIPKSGSDATDEHGRDLLAYTLMMKKHQVKLKQTWVVEIGLNVLSH